MDSRWSRLVLAQVLECRYVCGHNRSYFSIITLMLILAEICRCLFLFLSHLHTAFSLSLTFFQSLCRHPKDKCYSVRELQPNIMHKLIHINYPSISIAILKLNEVVMLTINIRKKSFWLSFTSTLLKIKKKKKKFILEKTGISIYEKQSHHFFQDLGQRKILKLKKYSHWNCFLNKIQQLLFISKAVQAQINPREKINTK